MKIRSPSGDEIEAFPRLVHPAGIVVVNPLLSPETNASVLSPACGGGYVTVPAAPEIGVEATFLTAIREARSS